VSLDIEFRREALPPLTDLEGEWRRLEAAGDPSFFTSWHWIGAWLTALPPPSRPALLRGMTQGQTVALALLGTAVTRRRHGLVRSRGFYLNEVGAAEFDMTIEHNGPLAARDRAADAADALVAWFAAHGGEADELHFGGTLHRLPEAAVEGRGLGRYEVAPPSYSVELDRLAQSGGDLAPVLSANARQQLRRAFRRYEREGPLRLIEATTTTEALAFFAAMKTLHCASWERRRKAHSFSRGFFEPFHRRLIERSFAAGVIQLLEARAGDRPIGYLYNFRLNNRVYAYQSGFADSDPRERPGAVTHALAIQHACRRGMRVYDFMAGRNRLKESFATQVEPMLWQVVQQPRLAFRFEHLARRLKARLRPHGLPRTG
jgi:CelD/BcsL family acetyltransferase involved in cellulose biosynthesis